MMDGLQLEKLYVAIEAQTAEFNSQMKKVSGSIDDISTSTQKATSGASKAFKKFGKMLASIFIGAEITGFLKKMTELSYKAEEFKATTTAAMQAMANALTPILEELVKWIAQVVAWISGVFYAIIYGAGDAFNKYTEDVNKATKANKTFKGSLAGFDELNTVAQPDAAAATANPLIDINEQVKSGIEFWKEYGATVQAVLAGIAALLAVIALNNAIQLVGTLGQSFMTFIALGGKGLGFFGTFFEAISTQVMAPLSELASGTGPVAAAATTMWGFLEDIGVKFGLAAGSAAAPFAGLLVVIGAVVAAVAAIWYALDQLWKDTGPAGEQFRKIVGEVGKAIDNFFKVIEETAYLVLGPDSFLGKAIAIITTIILALVKVILEGLVGAFTIFNKMLKGDFSDITKVFKDFLDFLVKGFGPAWNNLWKNLGNGFIWLVNLVIKGINSMISGFLSPVNGLIDGWNNTIGKVTGKIPNIKIAIPLVPYLANGGMMGAGSLFVAGEAGAEMIGNYNGKTTVMPLENTSFVSAMGAAVYNAVVAGITETSGSGSTTLVVDGMTLAKAVEKNLNKLSLAKGGLDIAL